MDEESRRMKDLESVRTGQDVSIVNGHNSNAKDQPDEDLERQEEPEIKGQLESQVELNGVDEDLIEIIQSFKSHEKALAPFLRDGNKLAIEDLIVFKDKADDVIGYELDEFIAYLSRKYSLAKTKHTLKWDEILKALQEWAAFQTEDRKRERVEDWMEENDEYQPENMPFQEEDEDELDTEKYRQREKR